MTSRTSAEDVKNWLERYKEAWENGDAELAGSLFTKDAVYYETPFMQPLKGRKAIIEYWKSEEKVWKAIHFNIVKFWIVDKIFFAKWRCELVRISTNNSCRMAGLFMCSMNKNKLVNRFEEYWHCK